MIFNEQVTILLSDAPLGSFWLRKKYLSIDYRRLEIYKNILFENVLDCGGLQTLAKLISSDRDWMLKLVKRKGCALKYGDVNIRRDASLVFEAISSDRRAISFMDKSLQSNKELFMKLVKMDGLLLKHAHVKLRSDRDLVLEAVRNNNQAADYVTDKALITNDIEIVKYLVCSMNSLDCYDFELDRKVILKILSNNPSLIYQCKAAAEWREIIVEAVKLNLQIFTNLIYIDPKLQLDEQIVTSYLTAFPQNLLDIDSRLYYNRDFLLSVIKENPQIIAYMDFETRNDEKFALEMVKANVKALKYVPEFSNDEEILLEALKVTSTAYNLIGTNLLKSRDFHLKLADVVPQTYSSFPSHFQNDREIILKVISRSPYMFYRYKEYQDDTEIIEALIAQSIIHVVEFPNYISKIKDRSFLLDAIKSNAKVFSYIDSHIQSDSTFINQCMAVNAMVYEYLPKSIKNKREIMKKCIERNHRVLSLIKSTYWSDVDFLLKCCGYSHLCHDRAWNL